MTDVSHELGSLRFVVESPLSSKVAMFNNAVTKHKESQLLNPFSQSGALAKPTFKKGEYGKPIAGSLTEQRGQRANIHVLKEMLELCQIIDSEGYNVKDEPEMKVIPFGELFNIYTYISDKVVGILLRARKHKLVEFEGEVLFQHRDEDVPIFLLKPIKEIRQILTEKQEDIRRSVSPSPQATSVLMDKQKKHPSPSPSPTPKPKTSTTNEAKEETERAEPEIVKPIAQKANPVINVEDQSKVEVQQNIQDVTPHEEQLQSPAKDETAPEPSKVEVPTPAVPETIITPPTPTAEATETLSAAVKEETTDVNNNDKAPTIVLNEISSSSSSNANQSPVETTTAT